MLNLHTPEESGSERWLEGVDRLLIQDRWGDLVDDATNGVRVVAWDIVQLERFDTGALEEDAARLLIITEATGDLSKAGLFTRE